MLKNHQAIVTGNLTDPSASSEDVSGYLDSKVDISEFELTISELLATIDALTKRIEQLENPESGGE